MKLKLGLLLWLVLGLTACGGAAGPESVTDIKNLPLNVNVATVAELQKKPAEVFLLDVREESEYQNAHIAGATLIPLGQLANKFNELPKDKPIIAICHSGQRSSQATQLLLANGFENVHNMQGGMVAWSEANYPMER